MVKEEINKLARKKLDSRSNKLNAQCQTEINAMIEMTEDSLVRCWSFEE